MKRVALLSYLAAVSVALAMLGCADDPAPPEADAIGPRRAPSHSAVTDFPGVSVGYVQDGQLVQPRARSTGGTPVLVFEDSSTLDSLRRHMEGLTPEYRLDLISNSGVTTVYELGHVVSDYLNRLGTECTSATEFWARYQDIEDAYGHILMHNPDCPSDVTFYVPEGTEQFDPLLYNQDGLIVIGDQIVSIERMLPRDHLNPIEVQHTGGDSHWEEYTLYPGEDEGNGPGSGVGDGSDDNSGPGGGGGLVFNPSRTTQVRRSHVSADSSWCLMVQIDLLDDYDVSLTAWTLVDVPFPRTEDSHEKWMDRYQPYAFQLYSPINFNIFPSYAALFYTPGNQSSIRYSVGSMVSPQWGGSFDFRIWNAHMADRDPVTGEILYEDNGAGGTRPVYSAGNAFWGLVSMN